jgi:hypothetical protein
MSDEDCDAVIAAYAEYLREIRAALPLGLQMLAEAGGPVSIHDARIVSASSNGPDIELDLVVRAYSPGAGITKPLRHVHIVYRNVELFGLSGDQLSWRASDTQTEVLNGEVDVLEDGRFEHRISFSPWRGWAYDETYWVGFRFAEVDVAIVEFHDGAAFPIVPDR